MKLYSNPLSSNARRVRLTAAALGVPLEIVPVELADKTSRAALAAVNPNQKVPVLVDGDFVLWESNAIDVYLCEITPGQTLYPTEPRARAEVLRWLFWNTAHLSVSVGGLNFERMVKRLMGLGDPDAAAVATHERLFRQFAKVADDHLAQHPWLANDTMSLADLSLAATLMSAQSAQLPLEPYRHVTALCGRIHERPEWAASAT